MNPRVLIYAFVIYTILCGLSLAFGQLPDAPRPQPATAYDYSIWASVGAVHTAEFGLTEGCIHSTVCHEGVLPGFIWRHPAAITGTLAGFSVGQIEISRGLRHYRHRRLARAFDAANLVAFTGIDVYMGTMLNQKPAVGRQPII
jgi:hypothetical protein